MKKQNTLILGVILIFISFVVNQSIFNSNFIEGADLPKEIMKFRVRLISQIYTSSICVSLAVLIYGVGRIIIDRFLRWLIFYSTSLFFLLTGLIVALEYIAPDYIGSYKIFISFIISFTPCLVYYFYKSLKIQKK